MKTKILFFVVLVCIVATGARAQKLTLVVDKLPDNFLAKAQKLDYQFEEYSPFDGFSDGLLAIKGGPNSKWGFVDTTGRLVIDFAFSTAQANRAVAFSDGACVIEKDGTGMCYIDKTGKLLFDKKVLKTADGYAPTYFGPFNDGMAYVVLSKSAIAPAKGVFINKKGAIIPGSTTIANATLTDWLGYSEGLTIMRNEKSRFANGCLFGFVNIKGQWVIKPTYLEVSLFSEGLAAVLDPTSKRWGFIDKQGNVVISFRFSKQPHDFHDGVAIVKNSEDVDCIIDRTGAVLFKGVNSQNQIGQMRDFYKGYAIAGPLYLGWYNVIDKQGNPLYENKGGFFPMDFATGHFGWYRVDGENKQLIQGPPVNHSYNGFIGGFAKVKLKKDGKEYMGIMNRNYEYILLYDKPEW